MDMREINKGVIAEFRENEGRLSGPMAGAPILLLTTTGRTSGAPHITPLGFVDAGGRLAVAAANGGADQDPDWFANLQASDRVTVEVGGATIASVAVAAQGQERDELLAKLVESLPGMADHVSATTREIPVVVITEA